MRSIGPTALAAATDTALNCNDRNPCTTDSCVAATGCANAVMSGCVACGTSDDAGADEDAGTFPACSDNNLCNGVETCGSDDTCHAGTMLCDDGNPYTVDSCSPTGGCAHQMIAGCMACDSDDDCEDNAKCDGDEVCQNGTCHAGTARDCDDDDDDDQCTMDQCSAAHGCKHTAIMSDRCGPRAGAGGAGGSRAGSGSIAGSGGETADAGPDGGTDDDGDDGCDCRASGRGNNTMAGMWMLVLAWLALRRRKLR